MNIPNMRRLIEHLEAVPDELFNMRSWCGTSACIAGHGHELFFGEPIPEAEGGSGIAEDHAIDRVSEALGLDVGSSDDLFMAQWRNYETHPGLSDVTRGMAIAHLRTLVAAEEAKEGKGA